MTRYLLRIAITLTAGAIFIWFTASWRIGVDFVVALLLVFVVWVFTGVVFQPRTWWRP